MTKRLIALLALILFVGGTVTTLLFTSKATAANGSNWQAGRIIDDGIFTDPNAMSAAQVQDFLNQKVGTGGHGRVAGQCDTNGQATSEYGGGTRAQYGSSHGNSAPFTCLKDYYEVPKTDPSPGIPASNYGGVPIPAGARSAAQLIWDAAQRYSISPKVLLVTIQKESAGPLTTDDWPFRSQYTYAMGAHCPDSGPGGSANCDANYAGFSMQIMESARLFRYYLDNMSQPWWPYKKPGNNDILYQNAKPECGSSVVNVITKATAALYTYTPYQPNRAALDNLYGLGDGCSAYGNRNFWRIFTDWFGTTYTPTFNAQYRAQSTNPYILTGNSTTVYMQFTNTGTGFWKDDDSNFTGYLPIHLATTNLINRSSDFQGSQWAAPSRPNVKFTKVLEGDGYNLAPDQHTVQPGQIVEFQFEINVPYDYAPGVYREYFQPILEGSSNFNMGAWTYMDIYVVKSIYNAGYESQSPYPTLTAGDNKTLFLRAKNNGNVAWYDDISVPAGKTPIHLATSGPINKQSAFGNLWSSRSRPARTFNKVYLADGVTLTDNQHVVMPGQIARFEFDIQASFAQAPGVYREYFQPIFEAPKNWDMNLVSYFDITVEAPQFSATYFKQSPYPTISKAQSSNVFFQYKNTGNTLWKDDVSNLPGYKATRLATTGPINRVSAFYAQTWFAPSRPNNIFSKVYEADAITLAADQHTVLPGQIAEFDLTLNVTGTMVSGTYREYFQPIIEGANAWDLGVVTYLDVKVP